MLPMLSSAYDAEIDGIYYNFSGTQATVTFQGRIDKYPFYATDYSGNITIPESVTYEGKTYTVTSLDGSAFKECDNLTSITIPKSVTSIGYECFYSCDNLTTAIIGSNESDIASTSIGGRAFYFCHSLDSVLIGNNVKEIGRDAFYECTNLVSLYIPNSVRSIGSHVFLGCTSLTTVKLPEYITSIEWSTFNGCSSLDSIAIPEAVENIGDEAFANCSSLSFINLPDSLKKLGWTVFQNDTSLTSISVPDKVTTIYLGTFENCKNLVEVSLGRNIKELLQGSFAYCPKLTKVYCYAENPPACHSEYAGYYGRGVGPFEQSSTGQATLYVPQTSINQYQSKSPWNSFMSIEAIPNNSYTLTYMLDGEAYKSYEIECGDFITPENVPNKKGMTFSGWSEVLETMPAHDVTLIGYYSWSMETINSVIYQVADTLKNEATVIGNDNLSGEVKILPSVEIGGYSYIVTAINDAFTNCIDMSSVIIPNSIESISPNAFQGCSNLVSVEFHTKVIPDCFKELISLKEVIISNDAHKISDNAFNGCSNIQTIEIGEKVEEIGERAFANIDKLADVICYAENVPNTDRTAFANSYIDYVTLHVPALSLKEYKEAALWKGFKEIVAISGTEKTFVLTYMVDGEIYKVFEVNVWDKITPEPLLEKEGYSFSGWSEIPDEMPPHDVIVTGRFIINQYKLTYIIDGKEYRSYEVDYNTTLTPETAPIRKGMTFSGWGEVPETMPAKDVTLKGTYNWSKETYVDIIYQVTDTLNNFAMVIGNDNISRETKILPVVEIGGDDYSVISIGSSAFYGCFGLTSITIPESVINIGNYAFGNCTGLKEVYSNAEQTPKIGSNSFDGVNVSAVMLVVPDNSFERYKAHPVWGLFWIETPTGIKEIDNEQLTIENAEYYDLNGRKFNSLPSGRSGGGHINIIRYSDGTTKKVQVK